MATADFFQKLLNTLSDISKSLIHVPFWQDYAFWSVVILAFTLYWLIKYTHATEKMAENQIMPAVDVNMVYDKTVNKTYFWFLNAAKIPALVSIKLKIGGSEKGTEILKLRIPPYHPHYRFFKKTATSFDFLEGKNKGITLNIIVTPAFNKDYGKVEFTKSYKFDATESRWNETTWGYPDPDFPA